MSVSSPNQLSRIWSFHTRARSLRPAWSTCGAWCLALGVVGALPSAWAQSAGATEPRTLTGWLTRMHQASVGRSYAGTLVVSVGSSMSASRISHVCDGKVQMEQVETLTGEPRTTIRRNSDVITFASKSKLAWVETRDSLGVFPALLRAPSNALALHYAVREAGIERVAGHLADVVQIAPNDGSRYGYRIWSEQKTGLVVRVQTVDASGAVLEQVAFSELQIDAPVSLRQLKQRMKNTEGYEVRKPVLHKTTVEAQGWRLKEAVPGFTSMGCHTRDEGAAPGAVDSMQCVLSDGLAAVSLFVEPFDPTRHGQESVAVMGATRSHALRVGARWITAMGEAPAETVRRIAASIERSP